MVVGEELTDLESEHEWWFDLTKHEFTVEYKEKVKKWFLVVKKKVE